MFLFYGFTPLPLLFVRSDGYDSLGDETNKSLDIAMFLVSGMIVSTFAFPILLSNTDPQYISTTHAFLTEMATILFYITGGLFFVAESDEFD